VATYPVSAEPPSLEGALHFTTIWLSPAVAVTEVGTVGTPAGAEGVTAVEAVEASLVPLAFVAVTAKV
jgi:hypothetical protein